MADRTDSTTNALSRRAALALPGLLAAPAAALGGIPHARKNPDAELIGLCTAWLEAVDTYNADGQGLEPEVDPLWQTICKIEEQLEGLEATTKAGLLALARVAQHEATQPDGSVNYSDSFTGDWPARIVRDLLAMAERGQA